MEEGLNGKRPHWKTTSMEDTLMEDNLNGRQPRKSPQWKTRLQENYSRRITYRKLVKFVELGPVQPMLVLVFCVKI